MIRLACPLALICVYGCAGAPPLSQPTPDQHVTFRVSSLGTRFLVEGEFWGSIRTSSRQVDVQVDSVHVQRPSARALPLAFLRVRGALATRTAASWRITGRSDAISIPDTLNPAFTMGPMHFSIPTPRGFNAARDYLVFQFEFPLLGAASASEAPATAYACGSPGMLVGTDSSASRREDASGSTRC